ncbi:hypothetical protein P171DRAFT_81124 [Karstenula rhodostoma CBS 690.94]|uniref:Uncharacterized protein n=1 Tax=Karstenula rhodostoma CBS 690.94 TaxID=1392251 RepID=A0A9P4PEU7_9PLEO|nr:hypothetical protein P171DRAFT_81124 [Karstenula rhodostoma CBS 690.94]
MVSRCTCFVLGHFRLRATAHVSHHPGHSQQWTPPNQRRAGHTCISNGVRAAVREPGERVRDPGFFLLDRFSHDPTQRSNRDQMAACMPTNSLRMVQTGGCIKTSWIGHSIAANARSGLAMSLYVPSHDGARLLSIVAPLPEPQTGVHLAVKESLRFFGSPERCSRYLNQGIPGLQGAR